MNRLKIIERSRARAEEAADALKRTVVLNGDGLDLDLLEEANISGMDAVLALTDDDKTNILGLRPRQDRGREARRRAGQRPVADRADRADGHRRLRQSAIR